MKTFTVDTHLSITDLIIRNLPSITHHPIEPGVLLDDLGADVLTREGLALDIMNATGRDIGEAECRDWCTVRDIMDAYEGRAA